MNDHKYYLTKASYRSMYKQSIDDPNSFWSKQAHRFIDWISPYPSYARYWEIIDRHQVNIFYTSPTALRALRSQGDDCLSKSGRASLQLLGTVDELIAPDVWHWFHEVVGKNRCPIVDTWWQTETGGVLITPVPGVQPLKAGSAGGPFFGIKPAIVDEAGAQVASGKILTASESSALARNDEVHLW
jgi:acyl-coenzyme A synthetase/AMP-(fatty) acid ligase